jgi:hypothetical protein
MSDGGAEVARRYKTTHCRSRHHSQPGRNQQEPSKGRACECLLGCANFPGPSRQPSWGGEAVAGDGSEGFQAVFEARHRPGSQIAFAAFDLLELDALAP